MSLPSVVLSSLMYRIVMDLVLVSPSGQASHMGGSTGTVGVEGVGVDGVGTVGVDGVSGMGEGSDGEFENVRKIQDYAP